MHANKTEVDYQLWHISIRFTALVTYDKKCGVAICLYAALQRLQKPYDLVRREKGVEEC